MDEIDEDVCEWIHQEVDDAEREALLYNLVFHSKDIYEEASTSQFNSANYPLSRKNTAFRLDAVKKIIPSRLDADCFNNKAASDSAVKQDNNLDGTYLNTYISTKQQNNKSGSSRHNEDNRNINNNIHSNKNVQIEFEGANHNSVIRYRNENINYRVPCHVNSISQFNSAGNNENITNPIEKIGCLNQLSPSPPSLPLSSLAKQREDFIHNANGKIFNPKIDERNIKNIHESISLTGIQCTLTDQCILDPSSHDNTSCNERMEVKSTISLHKDNLKIKHVPVLDIASSSNQTNHQEQLSPKTPLSKTAPLNIEFYTKQLLRNVPAAEQYPVEVINLDSDVESETENKSSDESIVEVSIPPKPPPLVIAISSDDSDEDCEKNKQPVINVSSTVNFNSVLSYENCNKDVEKNMHPVINIIPSTFNSSSNSTIPDLNTWPETSVTQSATFAGTSGYTPVRDKRKAYRMSHDTGEGGVSSCDFKTLSPVTKENVHSVVSASSGSGDNTRKSKSTKKKREKEKNYNFLKCKNWTSDMAKFYNTSWGGETFDHGVLQRKMSGNHTKWKILKEDKYGFVKSHTFVRFRCENCNQYGHFTANCPDPPKKISCYICGNEGHTVNYCENTVCLVCGRATGAFTEGCFACRSRGHPSHCTSCGAKGHFAWTCPGAWRKFHSTTSMDQITETPPTNHKHLSELVCCHCTGRGHVAENCRFQKQSHNFHKKIYKPSSDIASSTYVKRKKKKRKESLEDRRYLFHAKKRRVN